jgi:hypothetical protein
MVICRTSNCERNISSELNGARTKQVHVQEQRFISRRVQGAWHGSCFPEQPIDEWADRDQGRHARAAEQDVEWALPVEEPARVCQAPGLNPAGPNHIACPARRPLHPRQSSHPHRLTDVSDSETHHRDVG